jgi:hypothetical protein
MNPSGSNVLSTPTVALLVKSGAATSKDAVFMEAIAPI